MAYCACLNPCSFSSRNHGQIKFVFRKNRTGPEKKRSAERMWEEFILRRTIATVSIATGALIVIADQWAMLG